MVLLRLLPGAFPNEPRCERDAGLSPASSIGAGGLGCQTCGVGPGGRCAKRGVSVGSPRGKRTRSGKRGGSYGKTRAGASALLYVVFMRLFVTSAKWRTKRAIHLYSSPRRRP